MGERTQGLQDWTACTALQTSEKQGHFESRVKVSGYRNSESLLSVLKKFSLNELPKVSVSRKGLSDGWITEIL